MIPSGLSGAIKCGVVAVGIKRGFDIRRDFENVIERPTVTKQLQSCYNNILNKEHHSKGIFGGWLGSWGQSTTRYDANVCRNAMINGYASSTGNLSKAGQNKLSINARQARLDSLQLDQLFKYIWSSTANIGGINDSCRTLMNLYAERNTLNMQIRSVSDDQGNIEELLKLSQLFDTINASST